MIDATLRSQVFALDMQGLAELNRLICDTMDSRQRSVARSFCVGDLVSFRTRSGVTQSGTVIKTNQKTVSVRVGTTTWRVTATLLRLQVASVAA